MTFFSHRPYFFRSCLSLLCQMWYMTRKTSISEENSLMTPFFFSSYSFAHPTTLLLEILGVGCMGRPPSSIFCCWEDRPPSPSISLLSCYQVRSIYFRSQRHPFLAASVNHYSVQPGRAQGVAQETRCGRSNFLLRWLPGNVKDEPAALSLRRLIKRLIRSCFALRCVARSKERKPSNEFLTKRIYGHIIIYEIAVSQTFTKTACYKDGFLWLCCMCALAGFCTAR